MILDASPPKQRMALALPQSQRPMDRGVSRAREQEQVCQSSALPGAAAGLLGGGAMLTAEVVSHVEHAR